jgi:ABC-type Fe3+/spermidine/putrescine transport system ATPase subunit
MPGTLELREVTKEFTGRSGTHRAVDCVSLSIPSGIFFSLLGPSGCGKTTTLRMVGGFESPSAGEIWLNGQRIDQLPPYRRPVNTVFQSFALFPHLTVLGNIEFGLRSAKAKDLDGPVRRVIEQMELVGKEQRKPSELSGGERQRVALARALVLAPDVLLLDEPLSALDPRLRQQLRSELRSLQQTTGVTFLFVTHDQEEALSLSDQIALMNRGAIEQVGSSEELYNHPRTRFAASFFGAMNWFGAVGVRPENTKIGVSSAETRTAVGVVKSNGFFGAFRQVEVQMDAAGVALVRIPPAQKPPCAGERVTLSWSIADEVRIPA